MLGYKAAALCGGRLKKLGPEGAPAGIAPPMAAITCGGAGPGAPAPRPLVEGCMASAGPPPGRAPGAGGGRPHISLQRTPFIVGLAESSSAAFSAAERVVYVMKAQFFTSTWSSKVVSERANGSCTPESFHPRPTLPLSTFYCIIRHTSVPGGCGGLVYVY